MKSEFDVLFGVEQMNKVRFLVDNATRDSGHTPICTVVLDEFVIIKLCVDDKTSAATIVYQFAHELTHLVFYSYFGLSKAHADRREEAICTAMSLSILKKLKISESEFANVDAYTRNLKITDSTREGYVAGAYLAEKLNYDLRELKGLIENFDKFDFTISIAINGESEDT